jgi:hypothetical protein
VISRLIFGQRLRTLELVRSAKVATSAPAMTNWQR